MAQHLPIQAKHHCQLKTTHTTRDLMHGRLTHQPAPLGETGPDRLAASARRQAPVLFQRHCFPTPPGGTLPCRQAPRGAVILPVVPIAWRHQQAARRHTRSISLLILAHSLICSKTRTLPQPYPNQFKYVFSPSWHSTSEPLPINLLSLNHSTRHRIFFHFLYP